MKKLLLLCYGLMMLGCFGAGVVFAMEQSDTITIALIDADLSSDEVATGFQQMFDSSGCKTTIIQQHEVIEVEFSGYDLITICPTVESSWYDSSAVTAAIDASEKPIIGLGDSGYNLFGVFDLPIGMPNGMHMAADSTVLLRTDGPYYNFPNPIPIFEDSVVVLYTQSNRVGIAMWGPMAGVTQIGMGKKYRGYYYIVTYEDRFLLWGYGAPADSLTQTGKDLLMNMIYFIAGARPPEGPPAHWSFRSETGNSATVVIPAAIQPAIGSQLLQPGDFIGAFTPAGLCCGWIEWQQANAAMTVWGDDEQTPETDGFRAGELIHYRVFQRGSQREYTDVEVAYEQGDGLFASNAFMVLSQLKALETENPLLFVPQDTLNFRKDIDTLSFPVENHGGGELLWSATADPAKPWLVSIDPNSGSGDADVQVIVDRNQLSLSGDTTNIIIDSNGGSGQITVIIQKDFDLPADWDFVSETGNNATIILPVEANPTVDGEPLAENDYVGVFTPNGRCCGWRQWNGENLAITIWGDDDQTAEIDGFQVGEALHYRVYRVATMTEWTNIEVAYSQGDGLYSVNTIFILSQFNSREEEIPILSVSPDTLNFGMSEDTLSFQIESIGSGELSWSTTRIPQKAWLTDVVPTSGTGETEVKVIVDRTQLAELVDTTKIIINSNGGSDDVTVIIQQRITELPEHWDFIPHTGVNATVVLPLDANPNINGESLMAGDYIGVFTPADLCCGCAIWEQMNTAITVWGDNAQTAKIDGFQPQEQLLYRIYRPATAMEWTSVEVGYSQGTGLFEANQFMVLNRFEVIGTIISNSQRNLRPEKVQLHQNYPNPFNAQTTIGYDIVQRANVSLTILDIRGAVIRQWNLSQQQAGSYRIIWDGRDQNNREVASGVYLCRLRLQQMNDGIATREIMRKLTLLK